MERALFYARSESVQKDYIVREENFGELVAQAVGEHRTLLVGSGMRVEGCSGEQDRKSAQDPVAPSVHLRQRRGSGSI